MAKERRTRWTYMHVHKERVGLDDYVVRFDTARIAPFTEGSHGGGHGSKFTHNSYSAQGKPGRQPVHWRVVDGKFVVPAIEVYQRRGDPEESYLGERLSDEGWRQANGVSRRSERPNYFRQETVTHLRSNPIQVY